MNKCPNCGANLKLDRATGLKHCENCGYEEREELSFQNEMQFIDSGNKFLDLKEYKNAVDCYEKASQINPKNYAAWLGLAKAKTQNFAFIDENYVKIIDKYLKNAKNSASNEELKTVNQEQLKYEALKEKMLSFNKKLSKQLLISKLLGLGVIIFFVALSVVNLVFAINSSSGVIWKIAGFVLMLIGEVFVCSFVMFLMTKIDPAKKWEKVVCLILLVAFLVVVAVVDIMLAKTI